MRPSSSGNRETVHMTLARVKKGNERFEVAIEPDKAMLFKWKGQGDISDVLVAQKIFSDAHKGMIASETQLEAIFGTKDVLVVAKKIIDEGELQLSSAHVEKRKQQLFEELAKLIQTHADNPSTHETYTLAQITDAMKKIRVKVDEKNSSERQVQFIVHQLKNVMPITLEKHVIQIKMHADTLPHCYGIIKRFGNIKKETWEGLFWIGLVEISGGLDKELQKVINDKTKGNVEFNIKETIKE